MLLHISSFAVALAITALAQANNSAIHGTVADPTGAVIPKATFRITAPGGRAVGNCNFRCGWRI